MGPITRTIRVILDSEVKLLLLLLLHDEWGTLQCCVELSLSMLFAPGVLSEITHWGHYAAVVWFSVKK